MIKEALEILKYNPKWIEYNLLDKDFVLLQQEKYCQSNDKNTEHYRYKAFLRLLSEKESLTNEMVEQYLELAELDENEVMGKAAIAQLIDYPKLSIQQFEWLCSKVLINYPELHKRCKGRILLNELNNYTQMTDQLFHKLLNSEDASIHNQLLEKHHLSQTQLRMLSEEGANRAIRNLAKQALKYKNK